MSKYNDRMDHADAAVTLIKNSLVAAGEHVELNTLIYLDAELAIATAHAADQAVEQGKARGRLHGVPVVVKDNIHVAGMPNSAGTPALKNFIPKKSNAVVSALEAAGAVVMGKANMHELAFGVTSNNAAFGPVRNVRDHTKISGGSSGGTAVAIAANIVNMGLGTDTGGSTRIPAALNGIVGLRPTLGRYNSADVTPISSTRDTVGPMADSVKSIALMDSVITGETCVTDAAKLNGLRLGIPRDYFYALLSRDVRYNIESVLTILRKAGVELVDVELPGLEELNDKVSFPIALHEFIVEFPEYLKEHNTDVEFEELVSQIASPDVLGAVQSQLSPEAIPKSVYDDAINVFRPQLKKLYGDAFVSHHVDAFIFPATPCAAQPIASSDETVSINSQQVPTFPTFVRNTDPSSNVGFPSLALPSGHTQDGLPVGILLDGPENSDRRLLEIGLAIEKLLS